MTPDVRRTPRRGTSSRIRSKRMHRRTHEKSYVRPADASFTRSFDPCAFPPHQHGRPKRSWWSVRFGITAGQTHASGRNQHWGRTGGRCAARRVSPLPQGRGVARQKRKEVEASVPARVREHRFGCSHVVFQLQKSAGGIWPRISSAPRPKKGGQGRVNGGLARSDGRRVKPSAGASGERSVARRPPP
jgi:hypothetical protein